MQIMNLAAVNLLPQGFNGLIDDPKFTKYVEDTYAMGAGLLQSIDENE